MKGVYFLLDFIHNWARETARNLRLGMRVTMWKKENRISRRKLTLGERHTGIAVLPTREIFLKAFH